jgi:hypothetical protein
VTRRNLGTAGAGFAFVMLFALAAFHFADPGTFTKLLTLFQPPFDPQDQAAYLAVMKDPSQAILAYSHGLIAVLDISAGAIVAMVAAYYFRKKTFLVRAVFAIVMIAAVLEPFLLSRAMLVARQPYSKIGIPADLRTLAERTINKRGPHEAPFRFYLSPQIINRTHLMDDFMECRGYDPLMPMNGANRVLLLDPKQTDHKLTTAPVFRMRALGVRYDISDWDPASHRPIEDSFFKVAETTATIMTLERKVTAGFPDETGFGPDYSNTNYIVPSMWGGEIVKPADLPSQFIWQTKQIQPMSDGPADGCGPAAGERIEWDESGRPDTREAKLILRRPGLLVLHETWLPGWSMQRDNEEIKPALCANKWMVAAMVPAGTHTVMFSYRPIYWKESWILAGLGLFICLVLFTARSYKAAGKSDPISSDWTPINDPWRMTK